MNDDKTIRLTVIQQAIDIETSRFKMSVVDPDKRVLTAEEIVATARKLYEFVNGDKAPATKA